MWCVKQMKSMTRNDLMAHEKLKRYAKAYPELAEYVQSIFDEVEAKVLAHLDITKDSWRDAIQSLEEKEKEI